MINTFLEYQQGTLPIIITAPQDGDLMPDNIPNRKNGSSVKDSNTAIFSKELSKTMENEFGKKPHYIICHLNRRKIDLNRSLKNGCEHELSEQIWYEWHRLIETACIAIKKEHNYGILLDIHGHGVVIIEYGWGTELKK